MSSLLSSRACAQAHVDSESCGPKEGAVRLSDTLICRPIASVPPDGQNVL
jgi:hypothetical protein